MPDIHDDNSLDPFQSLASDGFHVSLQPFWLDVRGASRIAQMTEADPGAASPAPPPAPLHDLRETVERAAGATLRRRPRPQLCLQGRWAFTRWVSDSLSPSRCIQSVVICEICVK
jgi:hypothetical protein